MRNQCQSRDIVFLYECRFLCREGDGSQPGSTALCDIQLLQVLSRCFHYGKFLAESKYQSDTTLVELLIHSTNISGLLETLVNEDSKQTILDRVYKKASHYTHRTSGEEGASQKAKSFFWQIRSLPCTSVYIFIYVATEYLGNTVVSFDLVSLVVCPFLTCKYAP
jgi:hypothetical protein